MTAKNAPVTNQAVWGDQVIPVRRLHLHLSNPRHEPVESEAEAIRLLCDDELIAELARDIAKRGQLSPLEVLGVVPMTGHPGHYVAIEGNRRTCALILLADPERAPKAYQNQLRRIASTAASLPTTVKVHVFRSESEGKEWIDLRHLGQQGGAGTKDWTPTQQLRAAGGNAQTSARANTLALAVLDRLTEAGLIENTQRDQIALSTLTRYLGTPGVRAILGLASPSELLYTHDTAEVDMALRRLVLDAIEPLEDGTFRVHSRSNSNDRLRYAHDLRSRGFAPVTPVDAPTVPPEPKAPATPRTNEPKRRSTPRMDSQRFLFKSNFTVKSNDPVLLYLRDEAMRLPIAEYRFSANYLLRAIVERVMLLFLKSKGRHPSSDRAEDLARACTKLLKDLQAPRRVITTAEQAEHKSHSHSLHALGHAVHGGSVPAAEDTRARAATWLPVLTEMLKHT